MDSDTLMIYGIPAVSFLISGFATYSFSRHSIPAGLKFFGFVWLAISILLSIGLFTAEGWDGLFFVAALIGIIAPAGVGGLIGGWIGGTRKAHDTQIETSTGAGCTDPGARTR